MGPPSRPTRSRQHSTTPSPRHRLPQSGGSQAGQETTVLTEGSSFLRPGRQQQDRRTVRDSLLSYLMDFSLLRPGDSRLHRAHYVATTLSNLINYLSIYYLFIYPY